MTELLQTMETPATAIAEYLAVSEMGAPKERISYRGATTLRQLDAPEAETGALLFGAAVYDLGWLRRIAVRGEDRFRWLSGMVTNAVETLPDRTGACNLILNAQGRIQGDCYVWRDGNSLELEVSAEQSEALLAHLDRFIIMDDVELAPSADQSALGLAGPKAETILQALGLPVPAEELTSAMGMLGQIPVRVQRDYGPLVARFALWTSVDAIPALWKAALAAGANPAGSDALESLRIVEGVPAYGIDIQSRDLAQETSQLRAISFTKGCYLGQEIVERVRSRGQVHRHLRALELTPDAASQLPQLPQFPVPGSELRLAHGAPDAKPAGTLTSVAALQLPGIIRIFAIGMIRAEAEAGSQPLHYAGGTARILHVAPKFEVN